MASSASISAAPNDAAPVADAPSGDVGMPVPSTTPTGSLDRMQVRIGEPVWPLAERLFPVQGEWTLPDIDRLHRFDEDLRVELTDGCLDALPMPEAIHQAVQNLLWSLLMTRLGVHRVQTSGYRLYLDAGYRYPDVLATLDRTSFGTTGATAADFVVEVLSPGEDNRSRDEVTKRAEYAAAGVGEYWIVDTEAQTIRQLVLPAEAAAGEELAYREVGLFGRGQSVASAVIDGFAVALDDLFSPFDEPTDDAAPDAASESSAGRSKPNACSPSGPTRPH